MSERKTQTINKTLTIASTISIGVNIYIKNCAAHLISLFITNVDGLFPARVTAIVIKILKRIL